MKPQTLFAVALITLLAVADHAVAQGTAFTYQGRLNSAGSPATGNYDLAFSLWDGASGGAQLGSTLNHPATGVSNGLFAVTLDFGAGAFAGSPRWLEISVRSNSGASFNTLSPRQPVTPSPYAIYAAGANAAGLSGAVPSASVGGTYGNPVTFNNAGNQFAGSHTGSGAGLTNVNAATVGGLTASNFWQLGGNEVSAGQFLGSANNAAMEMKVHGIRALRLEPNTNGAPNVIGGAPNNFVATGTVGAFIGGGGALNYNTGTSIGNTPTNAIAADFGVVVGGSANTIETGANQATIGGGFNCVIQSNSYGGVIAGGSQSVIKRNTTSASIGGGDQNQIESGASFSVIGGGGVNVIQSNAASSVIGGGEINLIRSNSDHATIGGGKSNLIKTNASFATIPGGNSNLVAAPYGLAAGHQAQSLHEATFVWSDDSSASPFASSGANQFLIRAGGGVGINTNNPAGAALNVAGVARAGSAEVMGALRAPGAGVNTGTFAFIHKATVASIFGGSSHITQIDNPLCNGDPNAILIVTHNWSADTSLTASHPQVVGVFYYTATSHWNLFHEDGTTAMEAGDTFNVMIIKP